VTHGFVEPLYILPFDHRGSFQKKLFGWEGALTSKHTLASVLNRLPAVIKFEKASQGF